MIIRGDIAFVVSHLQSSLQIRALAFGLNCLVNCSACVITGKLEEDIIMSKRAPDKMNQIIGEMGRWQVKNILIVFFVGIPGLAHVYSSVFVAAKVDYWCLDNVTAEGVGGLRGKEACSLACQKGYGFDDSFWKATMITEWQLVCDDGKLAVLGKMIFFGGFAFGTFFAGLLSDKYGRKHAIVLMAQLLFGCGLLASIMPSYVSFIILWWATGN